MYPKCKSKNSFKKSLRIFKNFIIIFILKTVFKSDYKISMECRRFVVLSAVTLCAEYCDGARHRYFVLSSDVLSCNMLVAVSIYGKVM
jgi:hypothetical protein